MVVELALVIKVRMQVYITVVISRGNIRITYQSRNKQTNILQYAQTNCTGKSKHSNHHNSKGTKCKKGSHYKLNIRYKARQSQTVKTVPISGLYTIMLKYLYTICGTCKCCIDTYIAANLAISTFTVTDKPEKIICIGVVQHSKA